ncbi:hypothetical protein HD806DRAFT_225290 [Xylariaceae sp. AK1471]|nr:hypothetical protein HD806DRAFT_225290 [Xylariaceae sp. AK1471]
MAKWKELGEVPDSDDESTWDSQEPPPEPPAPASSACADAADAAKDTDFPESQAIWDIPLSSQISVEGNNAVPSPKSPEEPEPSTSTSGSPINDEPPRESIPPLSSLVDLGHIVESNALISRPVGQDRIESEESVPASQTDVAEHYAEAVFEVQHIPTSQETVQETGKTRKESSRPGRSLRPRKPIQEHPYLLESAQYSKTLKSHGLRPVRVQVEEAMRRRQEEDSQEHDFEDDSQVTNKDTAQEDTEESQEPGQFETVPVDDISLSDDEEPSPTPELHPARLQPEMQSSQEEEDEFPDPNDVEKWKSSRIAHQTHKRRAPPKVSSKRKLPKLGDSVQPLNDAPILPDLNEIFDIPASPPQTSPGVLAITPMTVVNRLGGKPVVTLTPKPSSDISSRMHTPAPAHQHSRLIDLTALENEDSENDSDGAGFRTASESEPDQVRVVARRMRGVLPASWLRLDQQTSAQNIKPTARHRSPDFSPERSVRKGVAQRRLLSPQSGNGSALFLDDDSDGSDSTIRLQAPEVSFRDITTPILEDDAVSVIEEDHVDRMFSGSTSASTSSSELQRKRKRGQQSIFNGQPGQRKRQQRITRLLSRTKSAPIAQTNYFHLSKDTIATEWPRKQNSDKRKAATSRPPRLSILDVVEPDAPTFIRIAARAVSKRRDRGRSSPSKKAIMLGTRQDTIDAVGVLKRWEGGMIKPRDSISQSTRPQPRQDELAQTTAQNHIIQTSRPLNPRVSRVTPSIRFSQPRRMAKQASMDDFVDARTTYQANLSLNTNDFLIERYRSHDSSFRQAQLEAAGDTASRYAFDARKKALDALYRRSRKPLPITRSIRLEQSIDRQAPAPNRQLTDKPLQSPENNGASEQPETRKRTQFRKQVTPQSVDVSAPQYIHANDPLPRELSPPTAGLDLSKSEGTGKLVGLAPYGTHYTQHFEVFPLDRGVFFHQSTIIGSGRLKRALDDKSADSVSSHRGRCTFTIDEKTLQWGQWDARTSSELGIIFDWVMDRLDGSPAAPEPGAVTAVQAADFILTYLQDHLTLSEPENADLFAGRLFGILQSFERRLKEILGGSKCSAQYLIEVLTRILIIIIQTLRLCQQLNKFSEAFQMEETLKRLATATAGILLRTDLEDVRALYGHLQDMSFREKGIRNDQYSIICWVTLIRVLEEARLPRAGFWEVIALTVLSPTADGTFDATVLEQAWCNLFTLLPLGEFDSAGVIISGIRHTAPLEGWTIPQQLLRRVFHLYQSNSRQSPSFNDYLRSIVSRCHYLVEQWGWCKCNAILGTIFDFFAAQDLHNLRNEEVYQSPQFLEQLSGSPSLATSSEDRCFHIFLKLIAMSIQRLRKFGMIKEIRNLVTRLLPNHNRQYDKMMATHETEIATLRNHHDLLCTLFWAAPPDIRPFIQSIEGLVNLGSSHKEACLINLRAWSRLSRFVVSSCEDTTTYKPFADWQRNIFQQVLEQFLSVEVEINRQLLGMSVEACENITQEHKNAVINRNKKVAMDLLHFSMKAFLDVMRHTATLGGASFVLNHYPLEQILTRLPFTSVDSDWGVLQVALDILDYYLTRIDDFARSEFMHVGETWHQEDAIMLLERKFVSPLISVVRGLVSVQSQDVGMGQLHDRDLCVEHAVTLAGRLSACLIHARLARTLQFFQVGKYHLFQDVSKPTASPARKYVALFLASLANKGIAEFKDLGLTSLDLFLSEITKPFEYLAYENRLAMSLKQHGEVCLENAIIEVGNTPDYSSNRDLFNYTIVSMRKVLLRADVGQKPGLQNQFSKALRFTMDKMKADLKLMVLNSPEHLNYVEFVRSIISLIRSQDLCPVDSFFYQISQEYSPSRQDPRLQTAGILSWGLKLEEGDSKAVSGLFYLLFPSFKIALANGELGNEANILKESMKHVNVFNFMLSTMLPAIIRTTTRVPAGWILLDTYIRAIDAQLSSACIHRQIGRDSMVDILALHTMVLAGADSLQTRASPEFRNEDVVSLTAMIKLLNILSPSVTAHLINEPESRIAKDFTEILDEVTEFTGAADAYLSGLVEHRDGEQASIIEGSRLFEGLGIPRPERVFPYNEQMDRFSSHMARDISNNWISNETTITIKGPSRPQKPSATQSGQGISLPRWETRSLFQGLVEQIRTWNHAHGMIMREEPHKALLNELFF